MSNMLSLILMGIGLFFWIWGTFGMFGRRSTAWKLHILGVADTLGSILIITGLWVRYPREWPLLLLAILSLAVWNTMLGYVIAHCSTRGTSK
ncbi:monovalent cation/H(+) antiporter subunit G [uncultured Desulfobacter sp.]|uniref:monovalent cation/H(+) antiporter subunit G n=1 Tax=uncultured Desulfobacter sp. TaxID=240139 RepID=UPI0029C8C3D7|nr:monovalent cation/H(+) antiporter subunit G [uncultured Desulfobacter sp.]